MRSDVGQLWYFTYPGRRQESIVFIYGKDDDSRYWSVFVKERGEVRHSSWAKEFFEDHSKSSSMARIERIA
jgi:hypothetical protein